MLNKVKLALRITNDYFDNEISDLISACELDLELVGIASSKIKSGTTDGLINQAIVNYCKAHFGYDNPDANRYLESYESIKKFLSTNQEYVQKEV